MRFDELSLPAAQPRRAMRSLLLENGTTTRVLVTLMLPQSKKIAVPLLAFLNSPALDYTCTQGPRRDDLRDFAAAGRMPRPKSFSHLPRPPFSPGNLHRDNMTSVLVNPNSSCSADIETEPVLGVDNSIVSNRPTVHKTSEEERHSPDDIGAHSTHVSRGEPSLLPEATVPSMGAKTEDPGGDGGQGGEIEEEQEGAAVPKPRIVRLWPSSADLGMISNGR